MNLFTEIISVDYYFGFPQNLYTLLDVAVVAPMLQKKSCLLVGMSKLSNRDSTDI